jgi:hypothetical protein
MAKCEIDKKSPDRLVPAQGTCLNSVTLQPFRGY